MSLSRAIAVALTLSLAISACGGRVKLKPQQGTSLPVKPEEAATLAEKKRAFLQKLLAEIEK